jgi:hypothetical protein
VKKKSTKKRKYLYPVTRPKIVSFVDSKYRGGLTLDIVLIGSLGHFIFKVGKASYLKSSYFNQKHIAGSGDTLQ